jgi:hypothetical protein
MTHLDQLYDLRVFMIYRDKQALCRKPAMCSCSRTRAATQRPALEYSFVSIALLAGLSGKAGSRQD